MKTFTLLFALLIGQAPANGQTAPASAPADPAVVEDLITINPFRPGTLPLAKSLRNFQLSRLNKPLAYETTKELQRLFSAFSLQSVVDNSRAGFSKATGQLTVLEYNVIQDLSDQRYLIKANWTAAGTLPAGTDLTAVILLERPAKVGQTGKCTVMHLGTVAASFTAKGFLPALEGKPLTLRREGFIECKSLEDNPASLQRFLEGIQAGAEVSVVTVELSPCKACGGIGFTREAQKGKLDDKRTPCTVCEGTKTTSASVETRFIP